MRAVTILVVLTMASSALAACYQPVDSDAAYVAVAFEADSIEFVEGLVYGDGVTDQLAEIELKLDLFLPPSLPSPPTDAANPAGGVPRSADPGVGDPVAGEPVAGYPGVGGPVVGGPMTPRPTLVLVHGGGFLFGDRADFHAEARQWAQRGYVVATPSYRLASEAPEGGFRDPGPGIDAAADGQLAVKWLRANATKFGIDTNRIAVIGSSAGGVVALGTGMTVDLTDGRFDGPESHVANAVISTGAPFPAFVDAQILTSKTAGAPALIHHYEEDWVTGFTGDETRFTCLVWSTEPSPHRCMPLIIEGSGHALDIGPESFLADEVYHPFLAAELDLASAPDPRPAQVPLVTT